MPEGVWRTAAESLDTAQHLLNTRRPFHAHEVLEDAWKAARSDERELWRGLAQLAVGLTHVERGNPAGAVSLLRRGAESIAAFATTRPHGVDVPGLMTWAASLADDIAAGSTMDADVRLAPALRAADDKTGPGR